ncbi:hypothetical protein [Vibrio campbellii]|uniref:hypothetical protein n=1 Tax=Vibrio campbellii TaxID=680 RepID=UPI000CE33CAC|nr:hypothetical protein [Vibrio campbellii]MCE7729249.1 hypothetical protein [Vibrio campbellii]
MTNNNHSKKREQGNQIITHDHDDLATNRRDINENNKFGRDTPQITQSQMTPRRPTSGNGSTTKK